MANLSAKQLEEKQEELDAGQLSGVEALDVLGKGKKPEEILDTAVSLGIIDSRDEIAKALPDHLEHFEKALDQLSPAKAFRSVYWKFLLEQEKSDTVIDNKNTKLIDNLKGKLRFDVDPELKLKGRAPLLAVFNRLFAMGLSSKEIEKLLIEKNEKVKNDGALQKEIDDLSGKKKALDEAKKLIEVEPKKSESAQVKLPLVHRDLMGLVDVSAGKTETISIDPLLGGLEQKHSDLEEAEKKAKEMKNKSENPKPHKNIFETLDKTFKKLGKVVPEGKTTNLKGIENDFLSTFRSFLEVDLTNIYNLGEWKINLLNKFDDLIDFLKELNKNYSLSKNKKFTSALNEIESDKKSLEGKNTPDELEAYYYSQTDIEKTDLGTSQQDVVDKTDAYNKGIEDFLSYISEPFEKIQKIGGIDADLKNKCDEFLKKLEGFKNDSDGLTLEKIKIFRENVYSPALKEVTDFIGSEIDKIDSPLNEKSSELERLSGEIAYLEKHKTTGVDAGKILDKALESGANPVELEKRKNDSKKADEKLKKIIEARDFLTGRKVNDLKVASEVYENSKEGFEGEQLDISVKRFRRQVNEYSDQLSAINKDGEKIIKDKNNRKDLFGKLVDAEEKLSKLETLQNSASVFVNLLKELVDHVKSMESVMPDAVKNIKELNSIQIKIASLDPTRSGFTCNLLDKNTKDLMNFIKDTGKLDDEFNKTISEREHELETAKKEVEKLELKKKGAKLNDAEAAKRIMKTILKEQDPKLSEEDLDKIATAILADDVTTIQNSEDYAELAKKAGAKELDSITDINIKEKILDLRLEMLDGKVDVPFKGLKPENFKSWPEIEKLFNTGRLNDENGFLLLVAHKEFDGETTSIQTVKIEKKLLVLLAKKLGIEKQLHVSGYNKVLEEAFQERLEYANSVIKKHISNIEEDKKKDDGNTAEYSVAKNKKEELESRKKILKEKLKRKEIERALFDKKWNEILEEEKSFGIKPDKIGFSQDSVVASYLHGPGAQWMKDLGVDTGKYLGRKALALPKMALGLGFKGALGLAKGALGLGYQGAMLPLRAAKYAAFVSAGMATAPFRWTNNFFRKNNKWENPFKIKAKVVADLGKAKEYVKGKASKTVEGVKSAVTTIPSAKWGEAKWQSEKYKDRSKVNVASLEAQAKEFAEKAVYAPVAVGSGMPDLEKHKKKIAEIQKMLGGESAGASSSESEKKAA